MNLYVLVEGRTAIKNIYKNWIPFVNNDLTYINYLGDFSQNNFYILAGQGQPYITTHKLKDAINDVNNIELIDRLIIAIDSEDNSLDQKHEELMNKISEYDCRVEIKIIIQHFCFETWLLGNPQVIRKRPSLPDLLDYMELFNARVSDPELLPAYEQKSWNRSQFAYQYLRAAMKDINSNTGRRVTYSKNHPGTVILKGYFNGVQNRYTQNNHIKSFEMFLDAFS